MNRKAVFFDADGTLCDMEKGVPQSTKEALKKLRENGHDAWLCTGRSRAFVSRYLEELPFTGMISACGATIEKDGERLFNKEMPPELSLIHIYNCAKWILEIGRIKDVTINLRHMMSFGKDTKFEIKVQNGGETVHSMKELVPIANKYLNEMKQE